MNVNSALLSLVLEHTLGLPYSADPIVAEGGVVLVLQSGTPTNPGEDYAIDVSEV